MRRRLAACAALLAGATGMLAAPASAASGTWGVGGYRYVDGVVCRSGLVTSPLASWDFGDGGREFLAEAVTSNGLQDSAALPTAGTPGRYVVPAIAGENGFASDADIAIYARLVTRYGGSRAAEVARAVLDHTDPGGAPSCVSAAAGAALVAQAARSAGPYTLTVAGPPAPAELGTSSPLTVVVRNGLGRPAAGVRVTVGADAAVFGGSATTAVTSGSDGTARTSFTPPEGLTSASIGFQVSASTAVGLEIASVVNGTGQQYASALYADAPQTYTAQAIVAVDQTAHPQLTVVGGSSGGVVNAALPIRLRVGGMHGHGGQVQLQVTGPTPLDAHALCAHAGASGDTTPAFTATPIDVLGDGTVEAGPWTPEHPGCYRLQARLSTTDAVPQASTQIRPAVLTVLDTTSAYQPAHTVVGAGPLSGTMTVSHAHGLAGTATMLLRGPARPVGGDCGTVNWAAVKVRTVVSFAVRADRAYPVRTQPVTATGCYRLSGSIALALPGSGPVRVPMQVADDGALFLVRPAVQLAADQTWAVSPAPVGTHVTVTGTYGQAATVRVAMLRAPSGALGCRGVVFTGAVRTAVGPAVPVTGDGTYAVPSGRTPQSGCYTLVPTVTMTANPAVRASGVLGAPGATVLAGLSPAAALGDLGPGKPLESPHSLAVLPTLLVFLAIIAGVAAWAVKLARDDRAERHRPSPGLDLFE